MLCITRGQDTDLKRIVELTLEMLRLVSDVAQCCMILHAMYNITRDQGADLKRIAEAAA